VDSKGTLLLVKKNYHLFKFKQGKSRLGEARPIFVSYLLLSDECCEIRM